MRDKASFYSRINGKKDLARKVRDMLKVNLRRRSYVWVGIEWSKMWNKSRTVTSESHL